MNWLPPARKQINMYGSTSTNGIGHKRSRVVWSSRLSPLTPPQHASWCQGQALFPSAAPTLLYRPSPLLPLSCCMRTASPSCPCNNGFIRPVHPIIWVQGQGKYAPASLSLQRRWSPPSQATTTTRPLHPPPHTRDTQYLTP
eukprot:351377-Chlamydomonas_euryale.AAC.6